MDEPCRVPGLCTRVLVCAPTLESNRDARDVSQDRHIVGGGHTGLQRVTGILSLAKGDGENATRPIRYSDKTDA
eukprot:4298397-Pleurochrysis_carterae.AAC.2